MPAPERGPRLAKRVLVMRVGVDLAHRTFLTRIAALNAAGSLTEDQVRTATYPPDVPAVPLVACPGWRASRPTRWFAMASRRCEVCVTRVETLLELLSAGMTIEEVLADYPDLERDDLLAALEFGALAAGRRRVIPLGAA